MEIDKRNMLVGVVVGGALGAAAALLIAKKHRKGVLENFSHRTSDLKRSFKKRNFIKDVNDTISERPAVWGGVAGTVLGAVAGLFIATRSDVDIRGYISDIYDEVSTNTWDMLNTFQVQAERLTQVASAQAADWIDRTLHISDDISSEVKLWAENIKIAAERAREEAFTIDESHRSEKIEAIVDWADKAEKIAEQVHNEVHDWISSVRHLVDNESPFKESRNGEANPLSDIVDWALLGINLWKNVKSVR